MKERKLFLEWDHAFCYWKNIFIEKYPSKESKWTYKIKVRKAGLHEENNNGEKVKKDSESTLSKNKAIV